mgnify:CR=1 FL=1
MICLHLNSLMANCTRDLDTISWEMQNLEFPYNAKFAISNISIEFGETLTSELIPIRCSLLENSPLNPDGTLICVETGKINNIYLPSHNFWKLDNIFPRHIEFSSAKINISKVTFFAVTLVITAS